MAPAAPAYSRRRTARAPRPADAAAAALALALALVALPAALSQPLNSNQGLPVSANPTGLAAQRIAVLGMNYTQAIYNWSDTDLLQAKINGECLEANFDACAAFGAPLAPSLRGPGPDPPTPIGCRRANLTDPTVIAWAQELSHSEAGHMRILREALLDAGVTPITCPTVDYENGFTEFYNRALNRTGDAVVKWDPFKDDLHFLISTETLESVGVQADLGLALFFRDPLYVAVLGGLTGGAAQFAAVDRALIWPHVNETLPEFNMTVKDFMDAVSSYRDSLDGPVSTDQPYVWAGGMNLVTSDANGVLPARLPQQWISIVQCGNDSGGCFFPEGQAGPISTTQPLQIPTVPQRLLRAANEPIAVAFGAPWAADPFVADTPPYTEGYTALRPPGQPYTSKAPEARPAPYQLPPAGERTHPTFRNASLGAVANPVDVPAAPQLMVPPGALSEAAAPARAVAPAPAAQAAAPAGAAPAVPAAPAAMPAPAAAAPASPLPAAAVPALPAPAAAAPVAAAPAAGGAAPAVTEAGPAAAPPAAPPAAAASPNVTG
ncbi:hypothetical protein Rsub_07462 [Raphidocelis subcapitata]|uniref:Uncharacterized protein n=1 Tax=Raphidocelis subcapitata TaxID=307507 RepID=A0A2V0P504_9CHLO|nr:hypothetical protein Rsub_07462 [Raphidocelis subcapitata]|eukprot:GBF94961.1 hypothetical protein Rsub_07462 [Raphidocelis subcapitata]